ncbi:MAG: PQQ-like beta-propeller repeat protein [Gemmataceae bacterium]|nr:PQQ-like beta-propeller repeat protein [Gemmataceae bacterium]MDW8266803.1 PQQ-binding-like beta-propeller repeat protein [Gemmataceae bacterium]
MRRLRSLVLIGWAAMTGLAADWPQWLGPARDGSTVEKVVPWTAPPKVAWRLPVGEGHSSPVVADGRVIVHVKVLDKDAEEVLAVDAGTGTVQWRVAYPRGSFTSIFGNGPRSTPIISGRRVYTLGVTGILTCLDVTDGKQLWQVDTAKEFKPPSLTFGVSSSPLIEGNLLLVNVGAKGASVVAFDKDQGSVVWKAGDDPASYSSPIAFGEGDRRQVVFLTQKGLLALKPADGSILWQFPFVDLLSESSSTPVRINDFLVASSVTRGSVALNLTEQDGKPKVAEKWTAPTLTCYFSTPVAVGKDQLYMVTGTVIPPPSATLRCVDPQTGKELWNKPRIGRYHAAMLRTADYRLLLLDDDGQLVLIDPDPKGYRELARAKICGKTWAHPALANGRLFVRDDRELIAVDLGK